MQLRFWSLSKRLCFFLLCVAPASSLAPRTIVTNSSTPTATTSIPNSQCSGPCYVTDWEYDSVSWTQTQISTTTLTEATLVYIVNHKNNATRTSTIFNQEVVSQKALFPPGTQAPPTNTNADGTITADVVVRDGSTSKTLHIAFPTFAYRDYLDPYPVYGNIPTVINGVSTCTELARNDPKTTAFPSHPLLPTGVQSIDADIFKSDPRGWTWGFNFVGNAEPLDLSKDTLLKPLVPDAFLWSCTISAVSLSSAAPAEFSVSGIYVTATSTSTEAGEDAQANSVNPPSLPSQALSSLAPLNLVPTESPAASEESPAAPQPVNPVPSMLPQSTPAPPSPPQPTPPSNAASPSNAAPKPESNAGTPNSQGQNISPQNPNPDVNSAASAAPLFPQTPGLNSLPTSGSNNLPLAASPNIAPPPLIIGTSTIIPNSQSQYVLPEGPTLAISSPITFSSGTSAIILELQSSNSQALLVSGSSTSTLGSIGPVGSPLQPQITMPPVLTVAGQTVTANSLGQYTLGSQTLSPGGEVTISGITVSLAAGGSDAVVGTSTEALGSYIIAGLGTGSGATASAEAFTGDAQVLAVPKILSRRSFFFAAAVSWVLCL